MRIHVLIYQTWPGLMNAPSVSRFSGLSVKTDIAAIKQQLSIYLYMLPGQTGIQGKTQPALLFRGQH